MILRAEPMLVAALGMLALACESSAAHPQPDFQVKYESERLLVGSSFDQDLCRGSIALLDRHVAELESAFGRDIEAKLLAYLYLREPDVCRQRRSQANACFIPPTAHAEYHVMGHELVHAYLHQLNENPIPFLDEGLALAFEGTVTAGFGVQVSPQIQKWYSELEWWEYQTAGHFTSWMLARFGEGAVLSVFESSEYGMTAAELSKVTQRIVGLSLEEIESEYAVHSKELYPAHGAFACVAGEPTAWPGEALSMDVGFDCDENIVLARLSDSETAPPQVWRRFTIDLPTAEYMITIDGAYGEIQQCLEAPADEAELLAPPEPAFPEWDYRRDYQLFQFAGLTDLSEEVSSNMALSAGTYTIWVGGPSEEVGSVRLSIAQQ